MNSFSDFENRLEGMFGRLPKLPTDILELIVAYGPYLVLIGGILSITSSGILGIFNGSFQPLMAGFFGYNYYLLVVLNIVYGIILILAFKPLLAHQMKGWHTLFYLTLLFALVSIVSLNILDLIGPLLSLYILFQIKQLYR